MAVEVVFRKAMIGVLLMLAACVPQSGDAPQSRGVERVVEPRSFAGKAPRGPDELRSAMLAGQNAARADAGVAPITWDAELAREADAYAHELAATGRFEHSEMADRPTRSGENLWTGTRGAYLYSEMVGHWVAEKRYFVNKPVPDSSTTGTFGDVAHYTQIIWPASTRMGCALESNARDDFLVCRYTPAGNVFGERVFNR
ncbi:serine protease [Stakelama sp. CBK3Z-3]|uniref:Serine protease n=2 Tax=Stakelama flava TaxID=2860338 RepID=A0ABS6XPJ4_9SPHN|nr:serine protease [Stakelama flava]